MFERKKCRNCGEKIKSNWRFCPYCGEEIGRKKPEFIRVLPFKGMFEDIDKEFERIDKMFRSKFFKFPSFRARFPIRGGGISITIHSATGRKPKVEIRTSGEYKKIEPEIKRRLGVKAPIEEVKEEIEKKPVRIPKVTEEPEAKVEKIGTKEIINIKLPGIKNEEDIEIKKLEQSIEVKAFAGDKAYFKLIPTAPNASVVRKEFKDGILKIEVER
jgi:HSP20 family molecular chaperone IbpA